MFHRLSKHLEFRQKYSAARRISNSLLGVWISRWNTIARVWYILTVKIFGHLIFAYHFAIFSISFFRCLEMSSKTVFRVWYITWRWRQLTSRLSKRLFMFAQIYLPGGSHIRNNFYRKQESSLGLIIRRCAGLMINADAPVSNLNGRVSFLSVMWCPLVLLYCPVYEKVLSSFL